MMEGEDFDVHLPEGETRGLHGDKGPTGGRGTPRGPRRVALGHSHDPTPRPFCRWWLRLRGKWPLRYVAAGSIVKMEYNQPPHGWSQCPFRYGDAMCGAVDPNPCDKTLRTCRVPVRFGGRKE